MIARDRWNDSVEQIPVRSNERNVDIDILRGLALFGVIIVNVFYFSIPDDYHYDYFMGLGDPVNVGIYKIITRLFYEKFYPIFSFLFGVGFYIQFIRVKQKGINANSLLIRRMFILLLIGIAHRFLVWEGDILLIYALFGFTLLAFERVPPKLLLIIGIILYSLPILLTVAKIIFGLSWPEPKVSDTFQGYVDFYTTSPYWEIARQRAHIVLSRFVNLEWLIYQLNRLAYFLFGLYAGKTTLIHTFASRKKYWLIVWIASLSVFLGYRAVQLMGLIELVESGSILWDVVNKILVGIADLAQVISYITGVLLLLTIPKIQQLLKPFAVVGRMALTVYLFHTTVYSFIFYSFGLGLYGQLSSVDFTVIAITVYISGFVFSSIWLRHFQYGPFEWAWRSLTYGTVLPVMKKTKV